MEFIAENLGTINNMTIRDEGDLYLLKRCVEEIEIRKAGIFSMVSKDALELSDAITLIDPYIQSITAIVCPQCAHVCCINRHGYYDYEDMIYIKSLNVPFPDYRSGQVDTEPCQFLSSKGCVIDRALRPFRCNWYFCEELIEHMESCGGRQYRLFLEGLKNAVHIRGRLLRDFYGFLCVP